MKSVPVTTERKSSALSRLASIAALCGLSYGLSLAQAPPPGSGNLNHNGYVRVIDGNTVEIRINGNQVGIGLIGIDVPQVNTPCGEVAANLLQSLTLQGALFEEDSAQQFDGLKRRLYVGKTRTSTSLAKELVRAGVAVPTGRGWEAGELATIAKESKTWKKGCLNGGKIGNKAGIEPALSSTPNNPEIQAFSSAASKKLSGEIANAMSASGFSDERVLAGLTRPTAFASLPDGRILVAQQNGIVRVIKNGVLLTTPFINISSQVNAYWDRGLLGIAADPNFAVNRYVYLLFTYENNGAQYNGTKTGRLIRVTASGDTAPVSSSLVLLGSVTGASCKLFPAGSDCIPSDSPSHTVGDLRFAPDGNLFVSLGDGAHFNTVDDDALRSQDLDSLGGKMLRITATGAGVASNPFWNGSGSSNRSKVWSYGLRNPFRFGVHPVAGLPYVGDVGWNTTEEINVARSGANLGWPCYEGTVRQSGYAPKTVCQTLYGQGTGAVQPPLVAWPHSGSAAASVGGAFYTGNSFPSSYFPASGQFTYFYGDYARRFIRSIRVDANHQLVSPPSDFATGMSNPLGMELAPDGSIIYLALGTSELRRMRYTAGNTPPTVNASALPLSGSVPLNVQFRASDSIDPDGDVLTYRWDFGDGSPTAVEPNPRHIYTTGGTFVASVTASDGRGASGNTSLSITAGNLPPVPTISSPSFDSRYRVGTAIQAQGSATDPEDGNLLAANLAWEVIIHHCPGGVCHQHPLQVGTGSGINFTAPDHGDDSYFEIRLTATDSGSLAASASLTIQPETTLITVETVPSGMSVVFDGTAGTSPMTRTTVIGSQHTVFAASPQMLGSLSYQWGRWSDSGAQQHAVIVPANPSMIVATFVPPFLVSPAAITLRSGQQQQFTVANGVSVVWSSSPAGVGTVSATGLYTAPAIISAAQTVAVIATSTLNASLTSTATVTLQPTATPPTTFQPGDVFAAVGAGRVARYQPDGTFVRTWTSPLGGYATRGVALDAVGNLYLALFGGHMIGRWNNQGTHLGRFGPILNTNPETLQFDSTGEALVTLGNTTKDVVKLSTAGVEVNRYDVRFQNAGVSSLALGLDGRTVYYTSEGSIIFRYDLQTKLQLAALPGLSGVTRAFALSLLPSGKLLVATEPNRVLLLSATGAIERQYTIPGVTAFRALALDPDGVTFWTAPLVGTSIYRVDLATGNLLQTVNVSANVPSATITGLAVYR